MQLQKFFRFHLKYLSWLLLCLMFSLAILYIIQCTQAASSAPRTPSLPLSIVIIAVDSLRADHLGCYGYPENTTPQLDKSSKRAVLFSEAYTNATKTTPSLVSLFTSLYPSVHDVRQINMKRTKLNEKIPLLAEILTKQGYNCKASTGGANAGQAFGLGRGFMTYNEQDLLIKDNDFSRINTEISPWINAQLESDKPFFYFIHTYRPHSPYLPPKPYHRIFDPDYSGTIISTSEQLPQSHSINQKKKNKLFWKSISNLTDDIHHLKALYDGEIRYTDKFIAHVLSSIDRKRFEKKVILIVLADHGQEFLEHGRCLHSNSLYDELLHIPLLLQLPGTTMQGVIKESSASIVDVMPTVLQLLGLTVNSPMQGKNLFQIPQKKNSENYVYAETSMKNDLHQCVRTQQFKLISTSKPQSQMLYYLTGDSGEQDNIIDKIEMKSIVLKLNNILDNQTQNNQVLKTNFGKSIPLELSKMEKKQLKTMGYSQ